MKPVKLDTESIIELLKEFKAKLEKEKMLDGNLCVNYDYTVNTEERARIVFKPMAWIKMQMLIQRYGSEVGWHLTAERGDKQYEYILTDCLVYPQSVTGVTVSNTVEEYQKWLYGDIHNPNESGGLPPEVFAALKCQGHSHVNMNCTPSTTDIADQKTILDRMKGDDFHIFTIQNKKGEAWWKIIDLANNVVIEDDEIDVGIEGYNPEFMADAKKMIKTGYTGYHNKNKKESTGGTKSSATNKNDKKENAYKDAYGYNYYHNYHDDYDDDDDDALWYKGYWY